MRTIDVLIEIARDCSPLRLCLCQVDYSKDDLWPRGEVSERLFHRTNKNVTFIDAVSINKEILNKYAAEDYVLNSQVCLHDGTIAHLPLLDFNIGVNEKSLVIIKEALALLGVKSGYILNSGSSYHFIGRDPMSIDDYVAFLNRSLLLSPITDGRWIAHQLINGSSNLRIGEKNNIIPHLICRIGWRKKEESGR